MNTKTEYYKIKTNYIYHPTIMCNIRIGDIVIVERWGCHYPNYRTAFNFFKMLDNSPLENERKIKKHYVVIGLVIHENGRDVIAYISSRDNQRFIIQVQGLKKIGEINNDDLTKIREKYTIQTLKRFL